MSDEIFSKRSPSRKQKLVRHIEHILLTNVWRDRIDKT